MLRYIDSPTLKIVGGGLRFVVNSERQWIINIVECQIDMKSILDGLGNWCDKICVQN